ncbi:MAG: translocation/assembly module TamB [Holosporales bacterium]|nr:translocation/assembly module TamB [Holosporales bacterium]
MERLLLVCVALLFLCFCALKLDIVQHTANILVNNRLKKSGWEMQIGRISGLFPISFDVDSVSFTKVDPKVDPPENKDPEVQLSGIKAKLNWKNFRFNVVCERSAISQSLGNQKSSEQESRAGAEYVAHQVIDSAKQTRKMIFLQPVVVATEDVVLNKLPLALFWLDQYAQPQKKLRAENSPNGSRAIFERNLLSFLSTLIVKEWKFGNARGTISADFRRKRPGAIIDVKAQFERTKISFLVNNINRGGDNGYVVGAKIAVENKNGPETINVNTSGEFTINRKVLAAQLQISYDKVPIEKLSSKNKVSKSCLVKVHVNNAEVANFEAMNPAIAAKPVITIEASGNFGNELESFIINGILNTDGNAQVKVQKGSNANFLWLWMDFLPDSAKFSLTSDDFNADGVIYDGGNITVENFSGSFKNTSFNLKKSLQINVFEKTFSAATFEVGKHRVNTSSGSLKEDGGTFSMTPVLLFSEKAGSIFYFGTYKISGTTHFNDSKFENIVVSFKSFFDKKQIQKWQEKSRVQNVDLLVNGEIQINKKDVFLQANVSTDNIEKVPVSDLPCSCQRNQENNGKSTGGGHSNVKNSAQKKLCCFINARNDSSAFVSNPNKKELKISCHFTPLSANVLNVFQAFIDLYEKSTNTNLNISTTEPKIISTKNLVSVDGEIKGQFSIAPLVVFLGTNDVLNGVLKVNLKVSNFLKKPDFSGSIKMTGGCYENTNNEVVIKDVMLDAVGFKDTIKVKAMRFTDGTKTGGQSAAVARNLYDINSPPQGTGSAHGAILLFSKDLCFDPQFNLKIKCNFFQGTYSEVVKARVTGNLNLVGPLSGASQKPMITGRAVVSPIVVNIAAAQAAPVQEAKIKMNLVGGSKSNKDANKSDAEEKGATSGVPSDRFKLKIALDSGSGVVVQGDNGLRCFLKGELYAEGALRSPYLVGELKLDEQKENVYNLFGRKVKVQAGKISYSPSPINEPFLDATAHTSINQTSIFINISGLPSNIKTDLRSVPSLSEEEILSLLLFKQQIEGLSIANQKRVKAFASQMLQNNPLKFIDKIRNAFNLDSVEVVEHQDLSSGQTKQSVRIGKQIKNVSIAVDKGISSGMDGKVSVFSDITPQICIEANAGTDKKDMGVGVQWKKRY